MFAEMSQPRQRAGVVRRPCCDCGPRSSGLGLGVMDEADGHAVREAEGPKISPIGLTLDRCREERKVGRWRRLGASVGSGIGGRHGGRSFMESERPVRRPYPRGQIAGQIKLQKK